MKRTILVWNKRRLEIVRAKGTADEIGDLCFDIRCELHGRRRAENDDDVRWQILRGHPRVRMP